MVLGIANHRKIPELQSIIREIGILHVAIRKEPYVYKTKIIPSSTLFCFHAQVNNDAPDSDNELGPSDADDDVNDEMNDDETEMEFIFIRDDSPEGDTETTTRNTRRRRREKPPQPVTDVLIITPNDVSLTSVRWPRLTVSVI